MKRTLIILLTSVIVFGCSKNYSVERNIPVSSTSSLSDTTFVTDTTDFYDISINEIRSVHVLGHKLISFAGSSGDSTFNILDYSFFSDTSGYADFEFHKGALKKAPDDSTLLLFNKTKIKNLLPGSYPYTQNPKLDNGIYFILRDSNGVTWNTMLGSGNQAGSSFSIEKQVNLDRNFATTGISHSIHIVCRFNCMLYDGKGHEKQISNGRLGLTLWL